MFDYDLAVLNEVEKRVFNQAVKRKIDSFPEDFMFRLTKKEWSSMTSQIVSSNIQTNDTQATNSSQIVMSSRKHRGESYLPYAFTEQRLQVF